MDSVIVVGASLAGWRATEGLRAGGFEGKISLVGEERHLPYDRPPLSKQVLAGTWPPEKAVLADKRRSSDLQVHEVLGRRATALDVARRAVDLDDGSALSADGIVLATGAAPRRLPGTESLGPADGLFVLRSIDDSLALRAALTAVERARLVVVGAGFIGSEVASTSAGLGCRVTVIEVMDVPLSNVLGPVVGAHCATLHGANGVSLRTGIGLERIERGGGDGGGSARLVVHLRDGEVLDADVVVVGIGVSPSTGWLESSGLTVDNGVVCDDRLFAADGIVAAGDMARWLWRHDGSEELIRIEHWEVAANAGAAAARSLLAGRADAPSFTPIPYFWSDQYGIRIQVLGNPGGNDEMVITEGSFEEGKFVAVYGRGGRLRAVMAIGKPRQLMGFRPLLENGASFDEALAHARS
ncbi:MAG TPA: FAD-dependent oxidoreductase [Acidimicrobiales bacterium]|jgi:NADPH-dependent 2,4-dienoyl-CoA reductase/sulfur reductase-like enzyme|nr:FAD-dependent oxidoreductase [Acidimicrobiales bacterium]